MRRPHPPEGFLQVRVRVHVQERVQIGINGTEVRFPHECRVELVDQSGWRRNGPRPVEDAKDRSPPVHGPDGIEDIEARDGGLVVPDRAEEHSIQIGPE